MKIQMEKDGEIILKKLKKVKQLSISDMSRNIPMKKSRVRIAVAYLMGTEKIEEIKVGMAKVYFLK